MMNEMNSCSKEHHSGPLIDQICADEICLEKGFICRDCLGNHHDHKLISTHELQKYLSDLANMQNEIIQDNKTDLLHKLDEIKNSIDSLKQKTLNEIELLTNIDM